MIYASWDKKLSNDLRKKLFATKDRVARARGGALWDTVKRLKTASAKLTGKEFARPPGKGRGVTSDLIKKRIVPYFSSETSAGVRVKDTPGAAISIGRFRQIQFDGGVGYYPYKTGGHIFVPQAFGPKNKRLKGGVYKRKGRSRMPIIIQKTFNLAQMWEKFSIAQKSIKEIDGVFEKSFAKRLKLNDLFNQGKVAVPKGYFR